MVLQLDSRIGLCFGVRRAERHVVRNRRKRAATASTHSAEIRRNRYLRRSFQRCQFRAQRIDVLQQAPRCVRRVAHVVMPVASSGVSASAMSRSLACPLPACLAEYKALSAARTKSLAPSVELEPHLIVELDFLLRQQASYLSRSINAAIRYQASPATIDSHSSTSCALRSTCLRFPFTVTVSLAVSG